MRRPIRSTYIKLLPGSLRRVVRAQYLYLSRLLYSWRYPGSQCQCNFCGFKASRFTADGYDNAVLYQKNVVAGGSRANARCPNCFSLDRERMVAAVLESLQLPSELCVLHVAPEKNLNRFLRERTGGTVFECDLTPDRYEWAKNFSKQDLTNLSFASDEFDLVVCNHVLEHIPDDGAALNEVYRVLKQGGFAVLQVPFSDTIEHTEEDLINFDPAHQLAKFGQISHVRIYSGADFIERAKRAGFESRRRTAEDLLPFSHLAFDSRESVFLFQKPPTTQTAMRGRANLLDSPSMV